MDIRTNQVSPINCGLAAGKQTHRINLGESGMPLMVVAGDAKDKQVEILEVILRLGQTLDEQDIPETGRWIILPTWAATQLKMSALGQVFLANIMAANDAAPTSYSGHFGVFDTFTIYTSDALPTGNLMPGEDIFLAWHVPCTRVLDSEISFAELLSSLQMVNEGAIAQAIVTH